MDQREDQSTWASGLCVHIEAVHLLLARDDCVGNDSSLPSSRPGSGLTFAALALGGVARLQSSSSEPYALASHFVCCATSSRSLEASGGP